MEKYIFQQPIHKKDHYYQNPYKNKSSNMISKKETHAFIQKKCKAKNAMKYKILEEQTDSDTPKKSCFKLKFTQWLKQLPLDQRYLAVKVYAPGLSKKIQETLIDLQNQCTQQGKKENSLNKKINARQIKQIIESIVLISDGQQFFDSIGFDFTYIDFPDKLFELLTLTLLESEKQSYLSEQCQIETSELKEVVSLVQKCQSKQELAIIIISFLRGQIFMKFQDKKPINLQEERNRKKQFSVFWRNLSEDSKRKILLLNKEDCKALSSFLTEKKIYLNPDILERQISDLIQMEKNQFCNKIFKCKLRKSLTYVTDYHELLYKTWKSELNRKKRRNRPPKNTNSQKSNQLSCNISKPSQKNINSQKSIVNLTRINHPQTNQKLGKRPLKPEKQHQNAQKIEKSEIKQPLNEKNLQKTIKLNASQNQGGTTGSVNISNNGNGTTNKRKRNRNNRRKKSVSAQSKETKATHKFMQQQKQDVQKMEQNNHMKEECSLDNPQTFKNENLSCIMLEKQQNAQLNPQAQKVQKIEVLIPPINYQEQIYSKLMNDLQEYSDLINEEANQFYERRIISYERIQFILGLWNIPIKLFGSCASGITIKNSDIDVAVDNSILNYFLTLPETQRHKAALQQLQLLFGQQPCITSLKLIKTAAIPLIKMKMDTSKKFAQIPGIQVHPIYLQSLNRQHSSQGEIHIDLTIETKNSQFECNHLGIISTDQINRWIKQIKPLHSIVITIKNYLTKMNLNSTYEGGLNTYSMICLVVAFIKKKKLENQTNVALVLQKMLQFYVQEFDEKQKGIDLTNQSQIFYDKQQLILVRSATNLDEPNKIPELTQSKSANYCHADLQIKDPLNNGKIMTKNCYLFPKIKDIFSKIYVECFVKQQLELERLFIGKVKQQEQIFIKKSNASDQQIRTKVTELLTQCKSSLINPFLTLFE